LFPHVSAAIQLTEAGKSLIRGDIIQYIYTDTHHSNPLCRVTALELVIQEALGYDKEKYREMLQEATKIVLGYFGFDRTVYGDTSRFLQNIWTIILSLLKLHNLYSISDLDSYILNLDETIGYILVNPNGTED
jgi:hypothetical protein